MKKIVHYIDGRRVTRPAKDHPSPFHWSLLRAVKRTKQTINGKMECGACWCIEGEYQFDLHHRHYDTWGREGLEDVILLCRPCHEVVTSRIRNARYAAGELRVEPRTEQQGGNGAARYRAEERVIEKMEPSYEVATPRFKAESSY